MQWIQVDLETPKLVTGVVTQGRPTSKEEWVQSFQIQYGNSVNNLQTIANNGTDTVSLFVHYLNLSFFIVFVQRSKCTTMELLLLISDFPGEYRYVQSRNQHVSRTVQSSIYPLGAVNMAWWNFLEIRISYMLKTQQKSLHHFPCCFRLL